jgi:diguanylate cyclase (GGDEF)-like protein
MIDMPRNHMLVTAHETSKAVMRASLTKSRQQPDLPMFLKPVLTGVLKPLGALGAAVVALDGPDGRPVKLCQTGKAPSSLLAASAVLLGASRSPSHGLCADNSPILAGPWPMRAGQQSIIVFWREIGAKPWKKQDYPLVQTVAAALRAVLKSVAVSAKAVPPHAMVDAVTGLSGARKFVTDLPRHFARLDREGLPGTMILISVDGFIRLQADLGRKGTDEVLRHTAVLLNRISRPTDVVARLDSNEFAIWMNGADQFTAAERAEQLRADAPQSLAVASRGLPVSLSVGIAARRSGSPETVTILMQRADFALHEAKKEGPGVWRVSQEEVN